MIDVQNGTNGLALALQGGGNFTGGYFTSNQFALTVLSEGNFTINGTVTSTNVFETGGNLVGNNVINGALTWAGGNWNSASSVTIASESIVTIASGLGNDMNMSGCQLTNNGTVVWASGTIQCGQGSAIYNYGLCNAQSDQTINNNYGGAVTPFNNYGTFRKSGGAGGGAYSLFASNVVFNQLAGVMDVQNGTNGLTLVLQGGGNFTGGYITTNQFGVTVLSSGNFTLSGTVTPTNVFEDSGNLVGNNVINGALTWEAGNWNSASSVTVPSDSIVTIAGGLGNDMDMSGCQLTNNGTVAWASGTIQCGNGSTIYNNGLWNAQSDQIVDNAYGGSAVFNNYGTLRKSGGDSASAYTLFTGGVFLNQLAGVIDVQNGTNGLALAFQGGGNFTGGYITTNQFGVTVLSSGGFNLNGTITGTNTWENQGNLVGNNVINGTLIWMGGNWNSATSVTIASNSTLTVAGGNNAMSGCLVTNNGAVLWESGTIQCGGGTVIYNNGLWNAQSDQTLTNAYGGTAVFNNYGTFRKSGGAGADAYSLFTSSVVFNQLAGVMDVQNGTNGLTLVLQGGGNFTGGYITTNQFGVTVLSSGNFTLSGTVTPTNVFEGGGNLAGNNVINGALTWEVGNWNSASSVTIAANSTLTVASGGGTNAMSGCLVTNNGTVVWASGTIGCGNGSAIYNYGLWNAQSDQTLTNAYGGTAVFNNRGILHKTGGTNSTAFLAAFVNQSGAMDADSGAVSLGGNNYSQGGGGLAINLGGTNSGQWGQLSAINGASLNGPLNIGLANGFVPVVGNQFRILSCANLSGSFTSTNMPGGIAVVYTNNGVILAVTNSVVGPFLSWTPTFPITYGTALSASQLNATASVPGTFTYSPTYGAVLNAGLNTLSLIFSPSNTSQYSNATDTVSLIVSPAPLTVRASSATRVFGQGNPVFAGTITGLVNGDDITAVYISSAIASSLAGSYPIVPSLVDPNNRQTNYTVSLVNGALAILPLNYNNLVLNTSNLLGYWPFTAGSQANSTVNGYTGDFVADAAVGSPGSDPQLIQSPSNTALVLDGNGSFVNTSLVGGLTNNQGSTIGWFNLSILPSTAGRIFTIAGESQDENDFDLQIADNDQINFYTDSGSSTVDPNALTANDLGVWHFVAATFTSGVSRNLYLDGVLVASSTPGAHNPAGTGTFAMGESDVFTGRFFEGSLADVAVFSRELTGTEVTNLYAAAVSVSARQPVIQIVAQSGSALTFTWSAITNQAYQIQASTNLAYGNWTNSGGVITATNSIITNSQAIGAYSQQFYRVVLLP